MENPAGMRINKYLAHHNYCSRREADAHIEAGSVLINGVRAKLGDIVHEHDTVEVQGLETKERVYLAYYKPTGVVTVGAQSGEQEIADVTNLPEGVYPVGRLDKESEGLLLLTNDGRIVEPLLHPTRAHEKEYRVTLDKPITHVAMVRLRQGVRVGAVGGKRNYKTQAAKVRKVARDVFDIVLTEGKNRQIRRMCGSIGYKVTSLKRFRIMDIHLGEIKPNQYRKLTEEETQNLLQSLGVK